MRPGFLTLLCLLMLPAPAPAASVTVTAPAPKPPEPVTLQDMTWMEIRDAIAAGKTTVIVPTGGTEQNGPHLALGKHNFTLDYTAMAIARRLGDALAAPVMPYVPEGTIAPPEGHMRFAGTLSLRPETFAAFLEDTARSLRQHGFRLICFVGEHGASQQLQQEVAARLSEEWKNEGVRVISVNEYYDDTNGQKAWLPSVNEKDPKPDAHGGLFDTAEMLAVRPLAVRRDKTGPYTEADWDRLGVTGPSDRATQLIGAKLVDLKVQAAVNQIQREKQQ